MSLPSRSIFNGKQATVSGWQARVNFDLSKSLSVFDSAKLDLRYTYSDSSAEITDRTVPVPERAAHFGTVNLSLGWRAGPLIVALSCRARPSIRSDRSKNKTSIASGLFAGIRP